MRRYVAARTDNMKNSPTRRTNATHGKARRGFRRQAGRGGARGWLGPSRMPTGVSASAVSSGRTLAGRRSMATNAVDGSASVGRMGEAQAAFVRRAGRGRMLVVALLRAGQAHCRPVGRSAAAAHQGGMGQRLQEIEGDRKQRRGQCRRAPALVGASANHGQVSHDLGRSGRVSLPQAVGVDWAHRCFSCRLGDGAPNTRNRNPQLERSLANRTKTFDNRSTRDCRADELPLNSMESGRIASCVRSPASVAKPGPKGLIERVGDFGFRPVERMKDANAADEHFVVNPFTGPHPVSAQCP